MRELRVSFPKPCSEDWETMRLEGCHRHCDRCCETIHDLSRLSFLEAEVLLRSGKKTCVRVHFDNDGRAVLKNGERQTGRLVMVALGASISLAASACQSVSPNGITTGAISGTVEKSPWAASVIATAEDGTRYRAKVKADGRYRIKNVPFGTYALKFVSDCKGSWDGGQVVVQNSEAVAATTTDPTDCIVIGMIEIDDRTA